MRGEFRFVISSECYDESIAFYRDRLSLQIIGAWNRSPEDRGTLFELASGIVEVLQAPPGRLVRPPEGMWILAEVDDVDAWHRRAVEQGVEVVHQLVDQPYGLREFGVRDPTGVQLFLFSPLP